jgi:hypothetical protein
VVGVPQPFSASGVLKEHPELEWAARGDAALHELSTNSTIRALPTGSYVHREPRVVRADTQLPRRLCEEVAETLVALGCLVGAIIDAIANPEAVW